MGARSQLRRFLAEVGRFLLVGGAATLVALVVFNVLVHGFLLGHAVLETRPIAAYVVANTLGMLISYQGSRTFVFSDRTARGSDGAFTAYAAINLATMVVPVVCLALSRDVLGRTDPISDNVAANVIGAWLGLGARFYLFRTFVFTRPLSLVELDDEPGAGLAPAGRDGAPVSELSTAVSTTGRARPPSA